MEKWVIRVAYWTKGKNPSMDIYDFMNVEVDAEDLEEAKLLVIEEMYRMKDVEYVQVIGSQPKVLKED